MAAITTNVGIKDFLANAFKEGPALSNTFEARFIMEGELGTWMSGAGFNNEGDAMRNLIVTCEEASLPGIMANTGQTTGRFLGEGQINYAHTKSYQDLSLSFICDADLKPVKFINRWMSLIFRDDGAGEQRYSKTRLSYPDTYMCKQMILTKAERDRSGTLSRNVNEYTFYNIWPYSLQSTPLSYGSSQLLSISANFYYRKWKGPGSTPISS